MKIKFILLFLLLLAPLAQSAILKYDFEVDVTISRYFGSDPTIASFLPSTGIYVGQLTYDDSTGPGVGSTPTVYTQNPAGVLGLSLTTNGVTWSTNPTGSFDVKVYDRPTTDAIVFQSDNDALINVPGLSIDYIKLAFFGSPSTLSNESIPSSIDLNDFNASPNNLDFRAIDSNNSEFRLFGTVTSLNASAVPEPSTYALLFLSTIGLFIYKRKKS